MRECFLNRDVKNSEFLIFGALAALTNVSKRFLVKIRMRKRFRALFIKIIFQTRDVHNVRLFEHNHCSMIKHVSARGRLFPKDFETETLYKQMGTVVSSPLRLFYNSIDRSTLRSIDRSIDQLIDQSIN